MTRLSDATVLGLLAGTAVMMTTTTSHAFLQPPPAAAAAASHRSLSGAVPALGGWRPRPSRGGLGVVLHARWPFGRRNTDTDEEEGKQAKSQVGCGCMLDYMTPRLKTVEPTVAVHR